MISEIEAEMVRARAIVTGTAIALALALTNPSLEDYRLWNTAPEISRVNLVVASIYDGHVLGVANFFYSF